MNKTMESVHSSSSHGHMLIQKLRMEVYSLVTKVEDRRPLKVDEQEEEFSLQDPEPEVDEEDDRDGENEDDNDHVELLQGGNGSESIHKRHTIQLKELEQPIKEMMFLDDSNPQVRKAMFAIERMLTHGLRRLDGRIVLKDQEDDDEKEEKEKYKQLQLDTVDLWGLILWTNHVLQQKHIHWLSINQPFVSKNENEQATSPFKIKGFNASLRTVHSLSNVQTPLGKFRAWLRRCLNTHILASCIESLFDESNSLMLEQYYNQHAVCLIPDTKEVFFSQLKMLDRMHFAFKIDDSSFDDVIYPFRSTVEHSKITTRHLVSISACSSLSTTFSSPLSSSSSLFNLLESKFRAAHTILKATPSSILSPFTLDDDTRAPCRAKTFGQPMKEIVSNIATCDLALLDAQIGIPNLVEGCCRLIDANVTSKDLFYTQIEVKRFRQIAQHVEKTGVLSIWSSVHHAIVILMKFLRDLPTSIFDSKITYQIFEIMDSTTMDEQKKMKKFQKLLNDPVKGIDPFCRPTFLRLLQTLERCFCPHFATQNGIQMEHVIQIFGNILFPKEGIHRHRGDTGITTTGTGTYTGNKKKFFFIEILLKNHFFLCEPMRLTFQRKTQLLVNKLQRIQQFKSQLNPYNTHTFVPQQSFVVEQELKILFKNLSSILINSKFSTAKKTWKHVGFYFDNDPFKELQGGGLLVIYALQFFVTKYPQRVAQMLQKRLEYTRNDYPFPNTSVHILRMVLQVLGILDVTIGTDILLNKKVELWPERWLQHCDQFTTCLSMEKSVDTLSSSSIDTSSCEGMFFVSSSESKWQFMEEETALYELFCMSMFLFDHFWTQSNANWMDFTFVLEKTKNQLENMFQFIAKTTNANNTTCLPDMLWTITEESLK